MRNKAPLALMEQLIMVLVFALAAAVCLQVFALSDRISREAQARDSAVVAVQSAAETLKGCSGDYTQAAQFLGGTWDGGTWTLYYDEMWRPASCESSVYQVCCSNADNEQPLLGVANVTAYTTEGNELYSICVAWQEGLD